MNRLLNALFKGIEVLISIALAVMILLVFTNVILRFIFDTGFAWSEEVARICFIYLVYLGSIEAMRDNRHLLIDSVIIRLPSTAQKLLYTLIQVLIIWLMTALTAGSYGLMLQNYHNKWVATGLPVWLVYLAGFIMGISILLLAAGNIFKLWIMKHTVKDLITPQDEGASTLE
ncbi:TRAP transporter small permease [Clostridium boliviensis]|uniref:TRAP transporter small permease n=1 Tax=Clostridium boliviensis TaxID=318465 RepID=A0ABU4GS81_9CLOT|nr:TRAP transporter small permease [Clostridium boliviensis]MDW2800461.1 TRAP transporter small permease [Clostridium boliviensis]